MKTTSERLKQIMKEQNLRQVDILKKSKPYQNELNIKMSKSHLSQYVNGKSSPDQHKLYLLSKTLNVGEAWLMGYDVDSYRVPDEERQKETILSKIIKTSSELQPPRQENVLNYAEEQLEEQNNEVRNIEKEPDNIISLDNHREKVAHPKMQSACAGDIGETLQDTPEEYEYFYPEDIPPTSDFCSLVNGDSMEPIMRENSYAFVEYTQYYKSGMIALITLNGHAYFKKLEDYEDTIKLVSANPNYKDIIITSEDDFKLIGKVVQ